MEKWLGMIPFLMVTKHHGERTIHLSFQRIVEAMIIAAILGLMVNYITVKEINIKITYIEKAIAQNTTDIEHLKNSVRNHRTLVEKP